MIFEESHGLAEGSIKGRMGQSPASRLPRTATVFDGRGAGTGGSVARTMVATWRRLLGRRTDSRPSRWPGLSDPYLRYREWPWTMRLQGNPVRNFRFGFHVGAVMSASLSFAIHADALAGSRWTASLRIDAPLASDGVEKASTCTGHIDGDGSASRESCCCHLDAQIVCMPADQCAADHGDCLRSDWGSCHLPNFKLRSERPRR